MRCTRSETDRIVAVRAGDGMIQIMNAVGKVEGAFGKIVSANAQGASANPANFRVAAGDLLGEVSHQVITAVEEAIDPCRQLYDPYSGKPINLAWSREGRFALDLAVCESGALTVIERRDETGRPDGTYWGCWDVTRNDRIFHTEFGIGVVAISAGQLVANSAGDEVATVNHEGRLEVWDTARRAKDPVVLYRVGDKAIQHFDLFVAEVDADSPGDEIVATTSTGNVIIYAAAGRTLRTLQLSEPALRVAAGNLTDETGREIVVVSRATGNMLIVDAAGHPLGIIPAQREKPFVDVAVIGQVRQRAPDSEPIRIPLSSGL